MTEFSTIPPPVWEEVEKYFNSKGLPIDFFQKEIVGWRTRSKLAIRGTSVRPLIGLFKVGTHEVEDLLRHPSHHPAIDATVALLRKGIKEYDLPPYAERTLKGLLRYAQFEVERKTGKVRLTLVINQKKVPPSLQRFIDSLTNDPLIHSLWLNVQLGSTNRIFGEQWILCHGDPLLWEELAGVKVCFHPACFAQAHLSLFEDLLNSIQKHIIPNSQVLEFYAGVGVIGLAIAEESKKLLSSEINPFSEPCFEKAKALLSPEVQNKISFQTADVTALLPLAEEVEVVIVDPPRKGLDSPLLKALQDQKSLKQIIYVSCGWLSFKRDAEALLSAGWKIEKAEAYLLFPGSDHLEILAFFSKKAF